MQAIGAGAGRFRPAERAKCPSRATYEAIACMAPGVSDSLSAASASRFSSSMARSTASISSRRCHFTSPTTRSGDKERFSLVAEVER